MLVTAAESLIGPNGSHDSAGRVQGCFEVGQVGVETTEAIDHREEVTVDNPLDHGDLCRSLPGTTLYCSHRRSLVNGDRYDKTSQIPMEWETDIPELLARHAMILLMSRLVVGW